MLIVLAKLAWMRFRANLLASVAVVLYAGLSRL